MLNLVSDLTTDQVADVFFHFYSHVRFAPCPLVIVRLLDLFPWFTCQSVLSVLTNYWHITEPQTALVLVGYCKSLWTKT